ncbi:cyclin domain protein [Trichuris suis]|nr:cyclin domain protein [Trichuris suis]
MFFQVHLSCAWSGVFLQGASLLFQYGVVTVLQDGCRSTCPNYLSRFSLTLFTIGLILELKKMTEASASLLFHRFQRSIPSSNQYCPYTLAAACIYLACKLEEDCRRCGKIVSVCYEILHPNGPTLTRGDFYDSLKKSVFLLEHHVIRQLGFRLNVKHPHDYLLHYLRSVIGWLTPSHVRISRLPKVAVTLLQDCYLHPVLIDEHPPQYIASAVLYVALSFCRIRVNCTSAENEREWWQIFCPSLTDDELLAVCHKILNIYDHSDYAMS